MILVVPDSSDLILEKKSSNKNFIGEDNLIYNIYLGDQNGSLVRQTWQELTGLSGRLRARKKTVAILTDITKLGEFNLAARKIGLMIMQELEYDRMAIFGSSTTKNLLKMMIAVSGRGFKIRVFENQTDAKKWLLVK